MRRHVVASTICLLLLGVCAQAQKTSRPLTEEGLRTAQVPRRYEPPSPAATAEELQERGDEYRGEKAFADAVDYYRAALGRTKDKAAQGVLYDKIGIAELQMQHLTEAQKNFDKAAKSRPGYAEAVNNQGVVFYMQKKYGKAIDRYRRAIKMREEDASFHYNLGAAYFDAKQFEPAQTEFSRAMQLDPSVFERNSHNGVSAQLSSPQDRARYCYIIARMYAQAGNFERSIHYLKRAMEDGYRGIGDVYKDREFTALRKDPRFAELMADRPTAIQE